MSDVYRKKPVEVEAMLYDGENMYEVVGFCGTNCQILREPQLPILIMTLEGSLMAKPGDWIIKGVKGEFYPCKPDVFAETYERATATAPDAGTGAK